VSTMDDKILEPFEGNSSTSETRKPSAIISIGSQRFEVRVQAKITPLRRHRAEVILIDRGKKAVTRCE
jgi:hypothetical protein